MDFIKMDKKENCQLTDKIMFYNKRLLQNGHIKLCWLAFKNNEIGNDQQLMNKFHLNS